MNPAISLGLLALPRHIALMAGLAIFSAIIVRGMIMLGVPDRPDARKAHSRTTPKSGGVGIVAAFMLGVLLLHRYGQVSRIAEGYFLGVIGAAFLMAGISFLDDLLDLSFVIKLATQLAAAVAAVAAGLWMPTLALPYYGVLNLGWAGMPLTVFFLLFVTNAMNFIDGLNGLAAGVTLFACLFLAGIAGIYGGFFVYTASLLLAGGVLGFLPFNFPQGRIFMGDVGSQFCGFMLALFGIAATRFEGAPLSFLLVPLLLSGVLYDVGFTLIRRLLAGENIARAHNGHLYQVVRRAGMDARVVALLHWGFTLLGGVCALVFLNLPPAWKPPFLLLPLAVQIGWTFYVRRRARTANIGVW
ncbi:undecaprenyl-phosphate alpha-N-acetylglucosaminyl 1-phosphate transferase [Acidocella aquatica]|uniref:Undecaprenyl-phosphate alpha-N-acetylglucosaminyl 1-phosphate transferase n=1 Tax=Acidocella aquatica TaxID=1922313 RepID=A0ABQ6A7L3_9PROT|nr:MraY family glycosyltransferase [Acidocella aquatica]GLR68440.1 undecaprenyl-phosphate alpha-N-acetylglucosaminyl 1-phosphate transferase [Acidocella aquatica]